MNPKRSSSKVGKGQKERSEMRLRIILIALLIALSGAGTLAYFPAGRCLFYAESGLVAVYGDRLYKYCWYTCPGGTYGGAWQKIEQTCPLATY